MTLPPQQRELFWDLAKAWLIFLVVAGHTTQYTSNGSSFWEMPLFKGIYLFHMPCFALISGYFAAGRIRENAQLFFPPRLRHLLLPALFLGSLKLAFHILTTYRNEMPLTFMACARSAMTLWFLWVLCECCIFAWILFRSRSWLWRAAWILLPVGAALALCCFPLSEHSVNTSRFTCPWS